jgi:hypothetical protein
MVVSSRGNEPIHRFSALMGEIMEYSKDQPLLSTYKRRTPPSSFNNTSRKRARRKRNTPRLRP